MENQEQLPPDEDAGGPWELVYSHYPDYRRNAQGVEQHRRDGRWMSWEEAELLDDEASAERIRINEEGRQYLRDLGVLLNDDEEDEDDEEGA